MFTISKSHGYTKNIPVYSLNDKKEKSTMYTKNIAMKFSILDGDKEEYQTSPDKIESGEFRLELSQEILAPFEEKEYTGQITIRIDGWTPNTKRFPLLIVE